MSIEARGGKDAYLYSVSGTLTVGFTEKIYHSTCFDVADSEDEAYGRAMKIARLVYRPEEGWHSHFVGTTKISGIDWVSRNEMEKIRPFPAEGA